jgi:trk system potassium uptake protein TrkA
MRILIVGGGKAGSYLAETLISDHAITIIEKRPELVEELRKRIPRATLIHGDGCEPHILERASVREKDLVAAITGDDEDNLVISFLVKFQHKVPLVFARINHPKNEWLFNRSWGVDVAVSSTSIIASLIKEEIGLGEIVTLLKFQSRDISLEEVTLPGNADAAGKSLSELNLPHSMSIVAIISGGEVKIPRGSSTLAGGDRILFLSRTDESEAIMRALGIEEAT